MRRFLLIFAAAFLLFSAPASAYTIIGGTPEQQSTVESTIESCAVDYRIVDAHFDPTIRFCPLFGVAGNSWLDGSIDLRDDLTGPYLAMVAAHEWSHAIYRMMPPQLWALWEDWCGPADYRVWTENPREAFAECARLALFPVDQTATRPLTALVATPADAEELVYLWRLIEASPFTDLGSEDAELQAAAASLAQEGIMQGYADGSFGAYQPLLKRHVALICQRAGLPAPGWLEDYTPATRGDVRDCVPGLTWLEERWDEGITRGQLARLIYRARYGG